MFDPASLIATHVDGLADVILRTRRLEPTAEALARALAPFEMEHSPSAYIHGEGLMAYVYAATGAAVVAVRRALAAEGIRLKEGDDVVRDLPTQGVQQHELMHGSAPVLVVFVFPQVEAARCKYVKVGTKTVEEPIYELRCEEAAA